MADFLMIHGAWHGGWRIPPAHTDQFDIGNAALEKHIADRMTDHPARTYQEVVQFANPAPKGCYVISTDRNPHPFAKTAERLRNAGWGVHETMGGHELPLTRPELISELLLETATNAET